MQVAWVLDHDQPAYVAERGGSELLSYLRSARSRADYRERATERAWALFEKAVAEGPDGPQIGGLALLVMQRALLAVEDLGRLLHAYGTDDPLSSWERLRSANLRDIEQAFAAALDDPVAAFGRVFRLPSAEQLGEEPNELNLTPPELAAFARLSVAVHRRWAFMLASVASLWATHSAAAKATMHGWPLVAGEHLLGPPPAGQLAEGTPRSRPPRFAVVLSSSLSGDHLHTTTSIANLTPPAVAAYRRGGKQAARLAAELGEAQSASIMRRYKFMVPLDLKRSLSSDDQDLIDAVMERHPERDVRTRDT